MKHALLCTLAMASCLLAPPAHAQLQWFGPLPTATKPAATPRPPAPPPRPARRQIDDGDGDILHSKHVGLPLELVIKDNQARVCQLSNRLTNVCAAIEAPLPPGTTVQLWNLPDGTIVLSYMRAPGVHGAPDANGTAARHFQAAFNGAARAVLTRTHSNGPKPNVEQACTDEDCNDIPGGDGAGGGNNGGSGGNISGGENGDVAVVEVHGKPDPDTAVPAVTGGSNYDDPDSSDPPLMLPPPDRREDLAGLTDPCIISPIATVCIVGKRPPLAVDEPPLPTGNPPIFPQWACNFAHIFCTRGQIPRDDNPGPADPPYNPSWPKQPQFNQCINGAAVKLDYCKTLIKIMPVDHVQQCVDSVNDMIDDCHLLYGPGK